MIDQVCSFELAGKLKTLGVEQDSVWYWVANMFFDPDPLGVKLGLATSNGCRLLDTAIIVTGGVECSAFTASELAAMLPINKCLIRFCDNHGFRMYENVWDVSYSSGSLGLETVSETLADALANMVITLKERDLI